MPVLGEGLAVGILQRADQQAGLVVVGYEQAGVLGGGRQGDELRRRVADGEAVPLVAIGGKAGGPGRRVGAVRLRGARRPAARRLGRSVRDIADPLRGWSAVMTQPDTQPDAAGFSSANTSRERSAPVCRRGSRKLPDLEGLGWLTVPGSTASASTMKRTCPCLPRFADRAAGDDQQARRRPGPALHGKRGADGLEIDDLELAGAAVAARDGDAVAQRQRLGEGRRAFDLGARQPVAFVTGDAAWSGLPCRPRLERQGGPAPSSALPNPRVSSRSVCQRPHRPPSTAAKPARAMIRALNVAVAEHATPCSHRRTYRNIQYRQILVEVWRRVGGENPR